MAFYILHVLPKGYIVDVMSAMVQFYQKLMIMSMIWVRFQAAR